MADWSAEIILRTHAPATPTQLAASIRRVLLLLEARGTLIVQNTEIRIVGMMPGHAIEELPLDVDDPIVEIVSIEAEPIGGPRH